MKKFMTIMLSLSFVLGAATMFAQDAPAEPAKKEKKAKKAKKAKKDAAAPEAAGDKK